MRLGQFARVGRGETNPQLLSDGFRDVTLHIEEIVRLASYVLGPEVGLGVRIDQLGLDAQALAFARDAAFQHAAARSARATAAMVGC
jgi:hypothetical protein